MGIKEFAAMWSGFSFMRGCKTAIANIPWLDDFIDVTRQKFLNPIVVRRITDSRDPDLQPALALYEARIPESQRFSPIDIIRWLTECKDTDCFLVAKYKRKVSGVSLFHFYPRRGLGLFAYMVVAKRVGLPIDQVSTQMMLKTLLREAKDCYGP